MFWADAQASLATGANSLRGLGPEVQLVENLANRVRGKHPVFSQGIHNWGNPVNAISSPLPTLSNHENVLVRPPERSFLRNLSSVSVGAGFAAEDSSSCISSGFSVFEESPALGANLSPPFSVDSLVLLKMAIGAEQQEPFRVSNDLFGRCSTGSSIPIALL
jgi:hypothetical protein